MSKVTIVLLLISTVLMVVVLGNGRRVLHGGEFAGRLRRSLLALVTLVGASFMAMVHAVKRDGVAVPLRGDLGKAASRGVDGPPSCGALWFAYPLEDRDSFPSGDESCLEPSMN